MPRRYEVSKEAHDQRVEASKKPRRKFTADLRQIARDVLGPALAGPGMKHLRKILVDGPGEDRHERYRWAMEFAANRVGLPQVMQHQVEDITPGREVVVKDRPDRPMGWLGGSTDAVAHDHDGRGAEPPALQ